MTTLRKVLPTLLYFYQGDITQAEVDTVQEAFSKYDTNFRKVTDINDTRDALERCAYASGAVPLIYFVRTSSGVLTGGILSDPLNRPNAAAAKKVSAVVDDEDTSKSSISTGHAQPTDANIAAKLLKEEIEQTPKELIVPKIKAADVKEDEQGSKASSTTGQVPTPAPTAPVAPNVPASDSKEAVTPVAPNVPVAPVVPPKA